MTTTKRVLLGAAGGILPAVLVILAVIYKLPEAIVRYEDVQRHNIMVAKLVNLTPAKLIATCGEPEVDEPADEIGYGWRTIGYSRKGLGMHTAQFRFHEGKFSHVELYEMQSDLSHDETYFKQDLGLEHRADTY
jgi:hypothetical protein